MSRRKIILRQAAIFGAIAGFVVFTIFYYLDPSLKHLIFIPIGALLGWGYTYTERKEKDPED
mgnify:FL=1